MHPIMEIVKAQKNGEKRGIYSCCSANEFVLQAAMNRAKEKNTFLLIESTSNQVNQDGGYTGMNPKDFMEHVKALAKKQEFPEELLILGGDHLGPLTWTNLPEEEAMKKAEKLIEAYVEAGFTKIHIDTSMRVADDDTKLRLSDEVIAGRGARLCKAAENTFAKRKEADKNAQAPVYIIGSEVPIPGGAQEAEDSISVTKPEDCELTIKAFQKAFEKEGLEDAWNRVAGLVVQPGVEFGDAEVFDYNHGKAKELVSYVKKQPFVLEGHSTDYQMKENLKEMVQDGIAILKVGPALTFGMREALFGLESMEQELLTGRKAKLSRFRETVEEVMLENPKQWEKHYHGDEVEKRIARSFSFSDRCRYYMGEERIQKAIELLLKNLETVKMPLSVVSQYFPMQYEKIRRGTLENAPKPILLDYIGKYCDDYLFATLNPPL